MPGFIPNSYLTPNAYLDDYMDYLTPEEWKIVSYLCRRIFGFQKSQDRISLSQFSKGITSRDGNRLDGGTGMGEPTIIKCLDFLVKVRLVIRISENDKQNSGTLWSLQLDDTKVDFEELKRRRDEKTSRYVSREAFKKTTDRGSPYTACTASPYTACTAPPTPRVGEVVHGVKTQYTVQNTVQNTDVLPQNARQHDPAPVQETKPPIVKRQSTFNALAAFEKRSRGNDTSSYPADVAPIVEEFCRLWKLSPPAPRKKGGEFGFWVNGARELSDACAEFGTGILAAAYATWQRRPFSVGHPGAVVRLVRDQAAEKRRQSVRSDSYAEVITS